MNKRFILYILLGGCFIMPIISVEGLTPWIVAIFFMYRIVKKFNVKENIKIAIINTIYCGSIILVYNVLGRWLEKILVKLLM